MAVLASLALPAYADFVRRSALPEAFSGLAELRLQVEQYFQDHQRYGSADGTCVAGTSDADMQLKDAHFFQFRCEALADRSGYVIQASGKAGTPAAGHVFTINQRGEHATTQFKSVPTLASCWLTTTARC